ncbi:MAG: hypothetical protein ACPGJS_00650 [Flammeovirgaceae bacterium]
MPKTIYHNDQLPIPKAWNELSAQQLLGVAEILPSADSRVNKIKRLCALLHNGKPKQQLVIDWEDAQAITQFLFEGIDLTVNKLPKLGNWYGPADRLKHSSFAEFISADTTCMKYIETQEPADLDKLVAILYRKKRINVRPDAPDFNGDLREAFNSHTVELRMKQLKRMDVAKKMAVLFFFAGCKGHFAKFFPYVFKKGGASNSNTTWMHALHQFTDNITQYEPVLDLKANMVLFDLNESQKDAIALRQKLEAK